MYNYMYFWPLIYFSSNGLRYHCERGRCEEGTRRTDSASDEEPPSEILQGYGAAAVKQEKLSSK